MSLLRRRKGSEPGKGPSPSSEPKVLSEEETEDDINKNNKKNKTKNKWSCLDSCCWGVGCICTLWLFLLFLYQMMPSPIPQYVTEAFTGPMPDPPGLKLKKEGLKVKHPVVFVPGIVTGGLELWEGCSGNGCGVVLLEKSIKDLHAGWITCHWTMKQDWIHQA